MLHARAASYAVVLTVILSIAVAQEEGPVSNWEVGTPIVTYWAGPAMTDAVARQMAEGGFNVVWCGEQELDLVHRHGLRAQLQDGLISLGSLEDPEARAKLDALIDRVKSHPALYSYYITDEPNASTFPQWAKLFAYLRERDPAHMAYLNLFPTYASNEQLGNTGDVVTAYTEHLRQYIDIVKPELVSYDHYHFTSGGGGGDGGQYFLNLALVRKASMDAGLPFLNIVQASSWSPSMRIPNADEMRFLVFTTLAYGAQGISYFVYCHPGIRGAIAYADGQPTGLYYVVQTLNPQFVRIATELQPLQSLGVYHLGMVPQGGVEPPADCAFSVDPPIARMDYNPPEKMKGLVLSVFGSEGRPTHAMVVNLDYTQKATTTVVGPGELEVFNAKEGTWQASRHGCRARVLLRPGEGKLVRTVR